MEDDAVLTFQAPFDPRLMRPLVRRLMTPVVAGVGAAGVLLAVLVALSGNRSVAVMIAASSVCTALVAPWYIASETVKRNAHRSGNMIAYRIDRTGVQTVGGFTTRTLAWSEITRTAQRRDQVALYFGRRSVQSIPTGTLTADERTHLEQLLRSRERTPAPR